jgi:hypothetical protein
MVSLLLFGRINICADIRRYLATWTSLVAPAQKSLVVFERFYYENSYAAYPYHYVILQNIFRHREIIIKRW